jgi:hypothetical protein
MAKKLGKLNGYNIIGIIALLSIYIIMLFSIVFNLGCNVRFDFMLTLLSTLIFVLAILFTLEGHYGGR